MDELLTSIAAKKQRLDELRPLSRKALASSAVESTLVIEKGITVGGKPLKDHLGALGHHDAIRYVRELAWQETPMIEVNIRNVHKLVMRRSALGGIPAAERKLCPTKLQRDSGLHYTKV